MAETDTEKLRRLHSSAVGRIERLRESRSVWFDRTRAAERELDEARADIAQLVENGDDMRTILENEMKANGCACEDHDPCVRHEAIIGWDDETEEHRDARKAKGERGV